MARTKQINDTGHKVSHEHKMAVADEMYRCWNLALEAYPELAEQAEPTICYFDNMYTAGRAYLRTYKVAFNSAIMADNFSEYTRHIIAHEVGHLIAHTLFRVNRERSIRPHGKEWRGVMRALCKPAEVTHTLNTESCNVRRVRTVEAKCDCRTHDITIIRANNMRKGSRYTARCCGGSLKLV